jgi:hypothetical protein
MGEKRGYEGKKRKVKVCPWDLKAWGGKLRGDSSKQGKAREGYSSSK